MMYEKIENNISDLETYYLKNRASLLILLPFLWMHVSGADVCIPYFCIVLCQTVACKAFVYLCLVLTLKEVVCLLNECSILTIFGMISFLLKNYKSQHKDMYIFKII